MTLGLDWKHIAAGCYIPIINRGLRQHLIACLRAALAHVARTSPGQSASAGSAVQRLIALNASHLARRFLHLWQAALRRRKKLRAQAAALALRNAERHRKQRFVTLIKFYNFRNESGRLWRPLLAKVRASLTRRFMHRLFLNRALNITLRRMRRALYMRYYRTLHFLVIRRRVSGARVSGFAEEGDRRKVRGSASTTTRDALRELAAATALVNPLRGMRLQMERHYAAIGDSLRVVAETGGAACVPALGRVIAAGRAVLPARRLVDVCDVARAHVVAEEFLDRRQRMYDWSLLLAKGFAVAHGCA